HKRLLCNNAAPAALTASSIRHRLISDACFHSPMRVDRVLLGIAPAARLVQPGMRFGGKKQSRSSQEAAVSKGEGGIVLRRQADNGWAAEELAEKVQSVAAALPGRCARPTSARLGHGSHRSESLARRASSSHR